MYIKSFSHYTAKSNLKPANGLHSMKIYHE